MARQRSEAEIEQLIQQYRASGLSQMAFSRQTGVVLSTLGRYLRRGAQPQQQLLPVTVNTAPEPTSGFALVLGNGRRIESDWRFADDQMARLIRVVEGA